MCSNFKDKYKSIIKKKKKKHYETTLLAKTNLDCIKSFICSSLTCSYIKQAYSPFTDVSREYDGMKEKISKLETS